MNSALHQLAECAASTELRVLVLAPTGADGQLTLDLLADARIHAELCRGVFDLCHRLERGSGAVIIAEEALMSSSLSVFVDALSGQPSWSDIPIVVITSTGEETAQSQRILEAFGRVGNVTLVERPFRRSTLLSTLEVALRARRRQYTVRDLLQQQVGAAESLRQSEERLRMALEATDLGTWDFDPISGQLTWSTRCKELFGLPADAPVSYETFLEGLHPDDRAEVDQVVRQTLNDAGNGTLDIEYRTVGLRDGGSTRWIRATGRAHFVEIEGQRRPARFIGTVQNITERKLSEQSLRQQKEDLEIEVQKRTAKLQETVGELEAFSYSITHDMRAPLRAMQGFAIALEEEAKNLTPECRDYLRRIINSANRMDQLIMDVLAYSRALRTDLQLHVVDFAAVARGLLENYPHFQSPDVEVRLEGSFRKILANEAALTQCISNFLHNAIKFVTPGQKPKIRIWPETNGGHVRFWFEDNGIGIKPEFRERIWGLFQRLDKRYEGTGLGLSIVRKAAERMGGTVGVESEFGKGSLFWIELRAADNPPPSQ